MIILLSLARRRFKRAESIPLTVLVVKNINLHVIFWYIIRLTNDNHKEIEKKMKEECTSNLVIFPLVVKI